MKEYQPQMASGELAEPLSELKQMVSREWYSQWIESSELEEWIQKHATADIISDQIKEPDTGFWYLGEPQSPLAMASLTLYGNMASFENIYCRTRRRGLGGILVKMLLAHSQALGCTRVEAFSLSQNLSAERFLKSHGFGQGASLIWPELSWTSNMETYNDYFPGLAEKCFSKEFPTTDSHALSVAKI